jgi:catechol 2,3-dioxygenase-like lactoylglutathione lyase family enzyme
MTKAFDRIVIVVPDMDTALGEYRQLLNAAPASMAGGPEPSAWWGLDNTVIELVRGEVEAPSIRALVLSTAHADATERALPNGLGLDVALCNGGRSAAFREASPTALCPGLAVDHVVLRTGDPDGCIAFFGEELGIRLALDKTVPEWGGRMLFFRAGKLTLEVITGADSDLGDDGFWGIAYQCADLQAFAAELASRGVAVSAVREGRKPGTRVATLKSHCLGIPTLLIQPAT